jgi:hypothetical protein
VSPHEPARHEFPCKKFQAGTGTGFFDHIAHRIRFFTMATAWGPNPTAEGSVIETIILTLDSRKEDFMRHPPVMTFPDLWLAPNKLRHDSKSPIF